MMAHEHRVHTAVFRFYAELNDFLPEEARGRQVEYRFHGSPGIVDAIQAIGVPHTEVDLIVAGGESVGSDYRLEPGDRVAVYPVFESFDIRPAVRLRPEPLRVTRFVLDVHLGKLARTLRLLGFDCVYHRRADDAEIIGISLSEGRIILTRDIGLLKSGSVTHGYWVRSVDPREQIEEVVKRFDLRGQARPFTRCTLCNGMIFPEDARDTAGEVPARVRGRQTRYYRCDACGKLYWQGTHFDRLKRYVAEILGP